MKKVFIIILSVLFFAGLLFSQDFRDFNWGDSRGKIVEMEGEYFISKSDDSLIYMKDMGGKNRILVYMFKEEKLTSACWKIEADEYSDYVDILKNKYGDPVDFSIDSCVWLIDNRTVIGIQTDFFKTAMIVFTSYVEMLKDSEERKTQQSAGL